MRRLGAQMLGLLASMYDDGVGGCVARRAPRELSASPLHPSHVFGSRQRSGLKGRDRLLATGKRMAHFKCHDLSRPSAVGVGSEAHPPMRMGVAEEAAVLSVLGV